MRRPALIPRSVLFGDPARMSPALSPAGDRLAYLAPHNGGLNIWVGAPDEHGFRPVTADERGIRSFVWGFDGRRLFYVQDRDGDENTHLFAVDTADGQIRDLTPFAGVQAGIVARSPELPDALLVGLNRRDPRLHDVYLADLSTGTLALAEENPGFSGWVTDHRLRVVAAVAPRKQGGADILARDEPGGHWRPVYRIDHAGFATFALRGITADGRLVALSSRDARATRLILIDLRTGDVTVAFEDQEGYDVVGTELHPVSCWPRLAIVERERTEIEVLDPGLGADLARLRAACGGALTLAGRDLADRRWLVLDLADNAPASYKLYDRSTGEIRFLFDHLPELARYQLARMEPFSFAARDGLRIHGYATFPPGQPRHRLPTVVEVHGGPWSRDRWGFRSLPQWLANRGYVCVQVNYRGSTGYGKDFVSAGDREWGGQMLGDIIDAVRHLVDAGIADPGRLAIYGASYGGYTALCAAAFEPAVFSCAACFAAPTDLRSFISSVPGTWNPTIAELHRRVGHPVRDAGFLWSRSPLSRVADIRIPLLIGHGARDPRVPQSEAEQLVAALRTRGVPHEYLLFPDEGHSLVKAANRMVFRAAMEQFLARTLGGRFEPAESIEPGGAAGTRMTVTFISPGGGGGRSGLTGSSDIPDTSTEAGPPGVRARLRNIATQIRGTIAGLPRVAGLVWEASPGLAIGLGVATVASGLVPAATAALARLLVNTVAASIRSSHATVRLPLAGMLHTPALTPANAVAVLVVAQLVVSGASAVATSAGAMCSQLLQDKLRLLIQSKVMAHADRLDLAFFEDSASYDLLRQTSQEVPVRPVTMISSVFGLVQTGVTFATMIGLLITLGPLFALMALISPLPAFASQARYSKRGYLVSMLTSPMRRRMQYLNDLVSTDTYAKEVKLFGLAPFLIQRFMLLASAFYARQRRIIVRRYTAGAAWASLSTLASTATYGYVAFSAVAGRLTLGDMTLYTVAATTVQSSVQGIFQGISGMYENNLYLDIFYRLLAAPARITAPKTPRRLHVPTPGRVVFEHVCFSYPGAPARAVDDVSIDVPPGQMLALVGRNGAGKSTMVKLLCRLYDPDEGRILIDGVDIRELDPAELRRQIGALFQDHVTYQATAAENIGLGDVAHIDDLARIEAAAAKAGAADLISGLPRSYDTPLGKWFDQGVNLSGGQRQVIALGRAFMRDAPILILDEPSAALDAHAEHDLFSRLSLLAAGRTTIYVSHRFSTVRQADHIVVLDSGRVCEQGTHDELMAIGSAYAQMFALQAQAYLPAR